MNSSMEANLHSSGALQWFPPHFSGIYRQPAPEECKPMAYDYSAYDCTPEQDYFNSSKLALDDNSYSPQTKPQTLSDNIKTEPCLDAPVADRTSAETLNSYQRIMFPGQYFPRPDSNPRLGWGKPEGIYPPELQPMKEANSLQPQDAIWESFSREPYAECLSALRVDALNFSAAKSDPTDFHSPHQVYTTLPQNCHRSSGDSVQDAVSARKAVDLETELEFQPSIICNSQSETVLPRAPDGSSKTSLLDSCQSLSQKFGPMKRYRNLRNVANRPKMLPSDLSPSKVYMPTRLEITGARIEDINRVPWDASELSDGRRIVRIEARQYGPLIHGSFQMVGSAQDNPVMAPAPMGVDVTEVSCLRYVSVEEGVTKSYYYITSVELVNIIDTLINIKVMDARSRRREKGRIRSNLSTYWSKNSLGSTRSIEEKDSADPRTQFARRISNYGVRKPRCLDKDVRVLSWSKLVPALQRAIQCYYTEIPLDEMGNYEDL